MTLRFFSPMRLTTDRYVSKGVGRSAIGFILDVFDDWKYIEFSWPKDGSTVAWLFLKSADLEPALEAAPRPVCASI